jgi:hypothetical protein
MLRAARKFAKRILKFAGRGETTTVWNLSRHVQVTANENGLVLLHTLRGVIFTTNHLGAQIWDGLREDQPVGEIVARLSGQYNLPLPRIQADTDCFLGELRSCGLLVPAREAR